AQFCWDWSTRLINVGIFRPVRLEWTTTARVDQLAIRSELSPDLKRGTVHARLFVEALREIPATLTINDRSQTITLRPALHAYDATWTIDNPTLWWPAEVGTPHLYPVRVTLMADGAMVGERATRVSFRQIRFDQSAHPQGGRYFVLEVN